MAVILFGTIMLKMHSADVLGVAADKLLNSLLFFFFNDNLNYPQNTLFYTKPQCYSARILHTDLLDLC